MVVSFFPTEYHKLRAMAKKSASYKKGGPDTRSGPLSGAATGGETAEKGRRPPAGG